ncbi:MAG: TRAP transporter fused permease subunit [Clostridiales bacterium]|nr:TRAP transporter fused permease subunit [Clostridiales bacterium]
MLDKLSEKKVISGMTFWIGLMWLGVQLYFMYIRPAHPLVFAPIFLSIALSVTFINKPFPFSDRFKVLRLLDFVMIAALVWVVYYYVTDDVRLTTRVAFVMPVYTRDVVAMFIVVVTLLEASRRVIGVNLLLFVLVFIAYGILGKYCPGILKFKGFAIPKLAEIFTMTTEGIYGTPLTTTSSTIFYFMFFGAFFTACGGGQVLIDLGLKVSRGSSGGAAQAAVISSGLMGMISGSAAANVSSTGVMTIPMMKRAGYKPEQAGAIEAAASTGGQIMPPIMGVGAFIMAEMLGISYRNIAMSAAIPAVAYFGSIFVLVMLVAKKNDYAAKKNRNDSREILTFEVEPILPRTFLLIPAVYLIYSVLSGGSLRSAALFSTILAIVINLLPFNRYRVKLSELRDAFISGTKQCANLALPTGACGIIIAVVTQSGFATRLSSLIAVLGGQNLLIALFVAMLGCMLLGMALPTAAAYLISVVLFVPVMVKIGLPLLVAHMFCFYYGAMAQITPPVCLASFTAASIADADSWKTGWTGFAYASVAFLIPYSFAYQPALLLMGDKRDTIVAVFFLIFGVVALASAISGWFVYLLKPVQRIAFLAIALLMIAPEVLSSVVGLVLFMICVVWNVRDRKKALPVM